MSAGPVRPERSLDDSVAVLTTPVLPAETNSYGNLFGGHLLALIDRVAAITAFRHARQNVVTASIEQVDFLRPVKLGDILTLTSRLNYVGRTSMEVFVDVGAENRLSGALEKACEAIVTFVAIDEHGNPSRVPGLRLDSEADRARFDDAQQRARMRKATRR